MQGHLNGQKLISGFAQRFYLFSIVCLRIVTGASWQIYILFIIAVQFPGLNSDMYTKELHYKSTTPAFSCLSARLIRQEAPCTNSSSQSRLNI
jgi:hypothetical protein